MQYLRIKNIKLCPRAFGEDLLRNEILNVGLNKMIKSDDFSFFYVKTFVKVIL